MIRKSEAGQALVIAAVAIVALLAVMGLAVDMGVLRYQKRLQQSAADAAAIAGASNLAYDGAGSPGVISGALAASAQNKFANTIGTGECVKPPTDLGKTDVQVIVCNPPSTGPHEGDAKYVEAYVSAGHPTFFMNVLGVNKETVTALAVATNVSGKSGTANDCIVTLGTPSSKLTANNAGLGTTGSVILNAPECGIADNGNFIANGGAQLSVTAASIGYGTGGVYNPPSGSATVNPTPTEMGMYTGDPLAGAYPTPTIGTSNGPIKITGGTCSGAGCSQVTCSGGACTIQPGTYDDICIDNNQVVNFGGSTGGVFVITGASMCNSNIEFQINAYSTVCNSLNTDCSGMPGTANSGVTFYITGSGSVNTSGTATIELVAPNSGTYEGLLFYQDPNDSTDMTLYGNGNSFYQGAIYIPNQTTTLYFGGNANFNSLAQYTMIVTGQLQLAGNPDVNINADYSGLADGGGPLTHMISSATLVE